MNTCIELVKFSMYNRLRTTDLETHTKESSLKFADSMAAEASNSSSQIFCIAAWSDTELAKLSRSAK